MSYKAIKTVWIGCIVLLIALDQLTKYLANTYLDYGIPINILPVFSLTLHYNPGAAFSFLSSAGGWQRWLFSGVAITVSMIFLYWLLHLRKGQGLLAAGLILIISGAIGNLYDRLHWGYVIDFLSVHYQTWYFPIFNLADSNITIGVVLLILDMLLYSEDTGQKKED